MSKEQSYVDKHRPKSFQDIQGHNKQLKGIRNWAENWTENDKPVLLIGPPGIGKTVTVEVVCEHMGWIMRGLNASDSRKSEDLADLASSLQSSPYENKQLCLLDEVDSLSGRANIDPLVNALRNAPNPMMLTANSKYDIPNKIKSSCITHEFSLGKRSRRAKLKKIVDKEDIDISSRDLARLTERPDLRSSINDLQRFAESDADSVPEDEREWDQGEFDLVGEALKGEEIELDNLKTREVQEFLIWLDENWRNNLSEMDKQLRGIEVAVAYDLLSRADTFIERARTEDYRFLAYASALMEIIGETRITSPYNRNWIDKSYPQWYRQKQSHHQDGSAESKLYQSLSNTESGKFGIGGNYTYFVRVLLPIMCDLPKETRLEICMSERVDKSAVTALNLKKSEYEDFKSGSEWSESSSTQSKSAMDW